MFSFDDNDVDFDDNAVDFDDNDVDLDDNDVDLDDNHDDKAYTGLTDSASEFRMKVFSAHTVHYVDGNANNDNWMVSAILLIVISFCKWYKKIS